MPFDGSGNFNRVMNWVNDALANIKILATRHDSEDDNFAAGLSLCITKDGQSQPTANIPMNGKRIVNLANPVNPQDAMTLAAFSAGGVRYDVAQALTAAQLLQAHQNLAATDTVLVKSAAYTLVQADRNKLLLVTGACTIALPTPAAVGNDYHISIKTLGGALTLTTPTGLIVQQPAPGATATSVVIPDNYVGDIWCDGTNWQLWKQPGGTLLVGSNFGVNGTYTKPNALQFLEVAVTGAGGGTQGTSTTGAGVSTATGGGGGGGTAIKLYAAADLAATEAYVVGQGVGGADGANSTFKSLIGGGGQGSALQTGNGSTFAVSNGGGGGAASGGDINIIGGNASQGIRAGHNLPSLAYGGEGGGSFFSEPVPGVWITSTAPGGNNAGWGQGVRGNANGPSQTGQAALAGSPGRIVFTEYF